MVARGQQMMSFAEFWAMMPVQVVGMNGVIDMLGETVSHEWIRQRFEQQVQPNDAIYYYCSEQAQWDMMMGSEGYLLVRDGEIIGSFTHRMN
jgi:hypothetical protein